MNSLATYIKSLNKGVKVGHDKVSILLYADDMVLLAPTENDLQYMLNAMADWAMKWRLKVNVLKYKIVHFRSKRKIGSDYAFKYAGDIIERVSSYKYLGILVRRKSHIGWNWSTDFFCRLIRVYIGLRQYFSEGVQNFVHWHFLKSNMNSLTTKDAYPLPQIDDSLRLLGNQ